MRNFRCLGFAACGTVGIAALVVAASARGQIEAPKGAAPSAGNPPSVNLPGAVPTPLHAAPQYSTYIEVAPDGSRAVRLYERPEFQRQQEQSKLARESESLASQYAEATDEAERQKIKAQLAELVGRQFETQQQTREDEVAQLEARVKKLRDLIEKRKEARQSIVDQRLEQLLREAEGLGWAPAPSGGNATFVPVRNFPSAGAARPTPISAPPETTATRR